MKIKEIYEIAVPAKKRKEEKYNVWVSLVVRPLSVLFTIPFIKTKIKPVTITKISIAFLLVAFIFLTFWHSLLFELIGWGFLFLWAIFDGVDGNLARLKNECSIMGDLWDTFGGYLAIIVLACTSGTIAFFDNELLLEFYPNYLNFILCGAIIVFSLLPRLMLHKKESVTNDESIKRIVDTTNYGFLKRVAGNMISPSGILQVVFLLCIIFNVMNFYVVFFFAVNLVIGTISTFKILR